MNVVNWSAVKSVLDTAAAYVVPTASIVVTYIVGRIQAAHTDRQTARRDVYQRLYQPFIKLLYKSRIWDNGFSRLSASERQEFADLVLNNIVYMSVNSLDWADIFYEHHLELESDLFGNVAVHMDESFDSLVEELMDCAGDLEEKLKIPNVSYMVKEKYKASIQQRDTLKKVETRILELMLDPQYRDDSAAVLRQIRDELSASVIGDLPFKMVEKYFRDKDLTSSADSSSGDPADDGGDVKDDCKQQ